MTRPDATLRPRAAGFRRWLAHKGWVHVVLLAGAGVFLFPFAWMVGTSLKTDDEISEDRLFPALPSQVVATPYVREAPEPRRPDDAPSSRWTQAVDDLRLFARSAVAQASVNDPALDAQVWRDQAADILVDRLAARISRAQWRDDGDLVAAVGATLTPDDIAGALDLVRGRIELTGVQWIGRDQRIADLGSGAALVKTLAVEGPGELAAIGAGARLSCDFSAGDTPVVLRLRFAIPAGFALDQLHKLVVSLRPDDSWHRLDAELDLAGRTWRSQRTIYLGEHRPMALVFQPPGFDDTTYRARTWIPLRMDDDARPPSVLHAELRLTLSPSSAARAVWGKTMRNYQRAFNAVPFWTYVGNSLILVALTMGGALFSSAFVAYAFARLHWPGRGVALILLLATMMLPGQVTMIPSFLIWRELGWYNTLNPLWVPAWFGNAFFIFLMVQQMKTIPRELEEAARIDGFNAVQTWWYIIVPQVKPTLAGIAIMTFMGAWNEFMGPLIFLRDQARFPLSLGLYGMSLEGADWPMMMAGNLLMTAPVIVIFFVCQRWFIQGVTMTGVKG